MNQNRQAILVVSFGTSHLDTLEKNIVAIEGALGEAFPHRTLRRAFTSGIIMRTLAKGGVDVDDVPTALTRLLEEGYDDVILQPTHIMNGEEYDKLMRQAAPFAPRFERIYYGKPLLTTVGDFQQVAKCLVDSLPRGEADTAIVYMGHGSSHFANSTYAQMHYIFHDMGRGDIVVGTVEGYPELPEVIRRLEEKEGIKKVILYPMMIVAGDHTKNDLAGDEEDSWKSVLEERGYDVTAVMQGMGEIPTIRAIYVNHAKEAVCDE